MELELTPRQVLIANVCIILALLCANTLCVVARLFFDHGRLFGFVPLFDFRLERNVPTFYSSIALLGASTLLFIIATRIRRSHGPPVAWYFLAAIFLFLSIDEIGGIHERLSVPTRRALDASGLLYFAWVVPYGVLVLVLLVAYAKFLSMLPKKTLYQFIAAGSLYIAGAIGFESLGGKHAQWFGTDNLVHAVYYTVEETLEMVGVALFIYALLSYSVDRFGPSTLRIVEARDC